MIYHRITKLDIQRYLRNGLASWIHYEDRKNRTSFYQELLSRDGDMVSEGFYSISPMAWGDSVFEILRDIKANDPDQV